MSTAISLALLLIGWSCYVASWPQPNHVKMSHQICNYYDLLEFLAPICSKHNQRHRREVNDQLSVKSKYLDDAKQAKNFLKSSIGRHRMRRATSRDVSYYDECCTSKICNYQELTEYCYVIPFGRLSY